VGNHPFEYNVCPNKEVRAATRLYALLVSHTRLFRIVGFRTHLLALSVAVQGAMHHLAQFTTPDRCVGPEAEAAATGRSRDDAAVRQSLHRCVAERCGWHVAEARPG